MVMVELKDSTYYCALPSAQRYAIRPNTIGIGLRLIRKSGLKAITKYTINEIAIIHQLWLREWGMD